ncbi:hypothetical protein DFQ28_002569 [Apophysomyces sp. BC1034]|nr:hypothetical protein DFQ30_004383 [Apophysomyces sp. BC1015]KAG0181756.1 hypothetical protein DFQ29_007187 [Apophysomyces sp. BC1021]KAG0193921.1 hypothetical protein DFQ28_002569 [Apophysomyces sp. BC1034]
MRVITESDKDNAAAYSMKGFYRGMAQWGAVGLAVSGILYSFSPWYRKTQTVNKFYIVMCFAMGGAAHKSDRYMVQFERRGRAELLTEAVRKREEILYGDYTEEPKKVLLNEA